MQIAREFADPPVAAVLPVHGEDQARADLYALVARLLFGAPDAALLEALAAADPICAGPDQRALEESWEKLVQASGVIDAAAAHEEYEALFISAGTPDINPYGSLYLCGYLNDKPLAALRADLSALGLARAPGVSELEDHLGALCETMRVLIAGGQGGRRQPLERQKQFFDTHLGPWYARCLGDIAAAARANYYRIVAAFATAFLAIEAEGFAADELVNE
jgi:TorA maturation chaperone TorD